MLLYVATRLSGHNRDVRVSLVLSENVLNGAVNGCTLNGHYAFNGPSFNGDSAFNGGFANGTTVCVTPASSPATDCPHDVHLVL